MSPGVGALKWKHIFSQHNITVIIKRCCLMKSCKRVNRNSLHKIEGRLSQAEETVHQNIEGIDNHICLIWNNGIYLKRWCHTSSGHWEKDVYLLNGTQTLGQPCGKHKIRFLLHRKYKTQVQIEDLNVKSKILSYYMIV